MNEWLAVPTLTSLCCLVLTGVSRLACGHLLWALLSPWALGMTPVSLSIFCIVLCMPPPPPVELEDL